MASVRKPKAPAYRVVLMDADDKELGFVPLKAFVSQKGNTWYGVPDPKSGGKKPAQSSYGLNVASKLVGLAAGELPTAAALYLDDNLIEQITLDEGVTTSGNPKMGCVVNVDTEEGMRRFTFRVSSLPTTEEGDRHNLAASVTRTGGGSGVVSEWATDE